MKSNFNDAAKHFQNGEINKAKEICLGILKTEPDNFNVLHLLGVGVWCGDFSFVGSDNRTDSFKLYG